MLSASKSPLHKSSVYRPIKARMVVVDGNMEEVESAINAIKNHGLDIEYQSVGSPSELKKALKQIDPHVVLSEYNPQGLDLADVIRISGTENPDLPVIVIADGEDQNALGEVAGLGAFDFVSRGAIQRLGFSIRHVLDQWVMRDDLRRLEAMLSDARDTRQALMHSQARYRELVESCNSAIIRWAYDGTILFSNSFCARLFGYAPNEMAGMPLAALFPKSDAVVRDIKSMTRDMLSNPEKYVNMHHKNVRRDGTFVWIAWTNRPVTDHQGNIVEFLSIGNNITELAQEEEALRQSEKLFKNFVNSVDAAIVRLSMDGKVTFINKYGEAVLGQTEHRLIGRHFVGSILSSEDTKASEQIHKIISKNQQSVRFESRNVDGLPQVQWMHWAAKVIDFGEAIGSEILCTGIDMTERRRMEQVIREREHEIRMLVEYSPDVIVRVDRTLNILYANRATKKALGYDHEWLRGKSLNRLGFDKKKTDFWQKEVERCFRSGKENEMEFSLDGPHGKRSYQTYLVPEKGSDGCVRSVLTFSRDITVQENNRKALQYRVRFERLISALSTRFINLTTAKIDRGIETALRLIGLFAGVDRSYMFLFDESKTLMSNRYEWVNDGVLPQKDSLQGLPLADFSWLMSSLNAGKSVVVSDTRNLPSQAKNEARVFESGSIKSLICLPLVSRSQIVGFIGFDAVKRRQQWSDNVVKLLQIVGSMFVNAVERKRSDEKIQTSERTYRSIFENTGTATTIIERDTTISLANERFTGMLGYSKQEVEGKMSWRKLAHPDDLQKLETHHFERRRSPETTARHYEARLVNRKGDVLEVIIVADLIGNTDKSVVSFVDITERKKYEKQLAGEREIAEERAQEAQEGRQILEALMEYIPEAIIIADSPDVRIRMMSRYASKLLCIPESQSNVSEHERPDRWGFYHLDGTTLPSPGELPLSRTVHRGEIVMDEEWIIKRPDGSSVIILVNGGPIYGEKGEISAGVVAWRDITQRKLAEEAVKDHSRQLERVNRKLIHKNRELDEANAKLKELDSLKSEFVSMASHELRTPLTGIIGFAETLMAKDIKLSDQERDKYLSIIEAEGKRLGLLLGELLDISKIEKGVHELVTSMTNVAALARETVSSMQIPPEVNVKINADDERKLRAPLDHDRMKQVFMNIIDNAIIFGRQKVDINIDIYLEDEKTIGVQIHDNGPGIPTDELEKIFEKFYRGRKNPPGESRGSGLGLSIAKGIVQAHGGTIMARSDIGKGTSIIFTISKRKNEYANPDYRR